MDVNQFISYVKSHRITFDVGVLEFINQIDMQYEKFEKCHISLRKVIKKIEISSEDLTILIEHLRGIDEILTQLKGIVETNKAYFSLLEELAEIIKDIFITVDYVHDLEWIGLRVMGAKSQSFNILELENLSRTIDTLEKILLFDPKMNREYRLSQSAQEIIHYCEILGSLNHEYLPYVVFWKLPPKLTLLYNSGKKIEANIKVFSKIIDKNYFSDSLSNAMKSIEKLERKLEQKTSVKIRGSGGTLKSIMWPIETFLLEISYILK